MTCIIGCKTSNGLIFASDSRVTIGNDNNMSTIKKVFSNNKIIFAVAGNVLINHILRYELDLSLMPKITNNNEERIVYDCLRSKLKEVFKPYKKEVLDEDGDLDAEILIGINGNLYHMLSSYTITKIYTDYAIIGCGKKYAYGAFEVLKNTILSETLPLKDLMKKALITASKFSLACDDNIEFFEE